jgi:hypothetical protein
LIAGLVEIFDGRFVNEGADAAMPNLDGVGVVPLNGTLDAIFTFQHEDHVSLSMHLLLQIKGFRMRAFRVPMCRLRLLMHQQRSITPGIEPATPCALGKRWPYQLAGP